MIKNDNHSLETYKSLMNIGLEALKVTFLLNGGAIVALLAFMGNVASKQKPISSDINFSIICFVIGLIFSAFSFVFAYIMQLRLYSETAVKFI